MKDELISVIVPVFNTEKYLECCLDSLLAQTYQNLEIILVDDGSSDSSGTICDQYADKDGRVRVIHQKNGGLSDARNCGLDHAHGGYIGFVDSDDTVSPDMYELLYARMAADGSDLAVCGYCRYDDGKIPDGKSYIDLKDEILNRQQAFFCYMEQFGGDYVGVWNKLYRAAVFDGLRFPVGKKYEDTFMIHHVLGRCKTVSHLSAVLYYYRMRKGSILHQDFSVRDLDILEAFIDQYRYGIRERNRQLAAFSSCRLSYRFEELHSRIKDNPEAKNRYRQLKQQSWFLLYAPDAWKYYSWKGKIAAKIRFLIS